MQIDPAVLSRIEKCMNDTSRLTMGEVEMLRTLQQKQIQQISFVEEKELSKIERKLKLS